IGLAATGRYKWYQVAWIGVAVAAVLHGLNDWGRVNGHPLWILVVLVSGILFLGYAKIGSRGDLHLDVGSLSAVWHLDAGALSALRLHGTPARHAVVSAAGQADGKEAGLRPTTMAGQAAPGAPTPSRRGRPWWEH